jgi:DNA polymerase III alpha subunit
MKMYIHTDKLLKNKTDDVKEILKETYGIAVFDEQFKKLKKDDKKYRYKKPHSIGYAYVLLIDFLKNSLKNG